MQLVYSEKVENNVTTKFSNFTISRCNVRVAGIARDPFYDPGTDYVSKTIRFAAFYRPNRRLGRSKCVADAKLRIGETEKWLARFAFREPLCGIDRIKMIQTRDKSHTLVNLLGTYGAAFESVYLRSARWRLYSSNTEVLQY